MNVNLVSLTPEQTFGIVGLVLLIFYSLSIATKAHPLGFVTNKLYSLMNITSKQVHEVTLFALCVIIPLSFLAATLSA